MLNKYSPLMIEEIHKVSYIRCMADTANALNRIASNITIDIQSVISHVKENLQNLDNARGYVKQVITVVLNSIENINAVKDNFSSAYQLWEDECLFVNANRIKQTICKSDHERDVIKIGSSEDSSSESDLIEVVNEIKYLIPQKCDDTDDEDYKNFYKVSDADCIQNESVQIIPSISDSTALQSDDKDVQSKKNEFNNSSGNSDTTCFSSALDSNNGLFAVAKPININLSLDTDKKLNSKCVVILHHLTQELINKYKRTPCKKERKKLFDDDEFLRLIDLDNLENPRKKKRILSSNESNTSDCKNSSSSSSSKHKVKRKNKKFKVSSSTSSVSSFYSSSDENSKISTNNNESFNCNNDSDLEKLLNERNEERIKQQLLKSDDSTDFEVEENDMNYKNNENNINENKQKVNEKSIKQNLNSDFPSSEDDEREQAAWTKDNLLKFKLHESDKNKKQMTVKTAVKKESDSASDIEFELTINRKKRRKSNILQLIDSSTDSDSMDSSNPINSSSSDNSDSDDCQIVQNNSQLSATTGAVTVTNIKPMGRRNIRELLDDEQVAEGTRRAGKDEENRLQRLAEHKNQLQILLAEKNKEKDTLILDFDFEKKIELIKVDRGLVKFLKPHQAEGVKFLWESCFETLEQVRKSEGSGCILAHCMGLGKTFQIVTLVHTLLVNKDIGVNTVMVICPMNTILNWVEEFDMWLKHTENQTKIRVYDLTQIKNQSSRIAQLMFWYDYGGVVIISYDMFRSFTSHEGKLNARMKQQMRSYLLNPGADFVVCDEGHYLKNENSQIAHRMQSIRTKRRVILTGTPLQNNLSEYHCMVQFVKPNLLGTKVEFQNRFTNPIVNGQFDNSTAKDVKLMKHRAHVLHRMLEGCVQRRDYAVLTPFLPPKQEYVILLRLSELQIEMYRFFIEKIARVDAKYSKLFKNYHEIKRLIAHPKVFQLEYIKAPKKYSKKSNRNNAVNGRNFSNNFTPTEEEYWWSKFVGVEQVFDFTQSYKLIFLYGILERCKMEGDKILVFSQSLYTLDLIEEFLKQADSQQKENGFINNPFNFQDEWKKGLDYYRMDGNVSSDKRNAMYKSFNNPDNKRARLFLISTKAGGLGVNLTGANRVVIFDPSWNPSNDLQSIFRIFRFGQSKPCYVYRLLTAGTMEQKIYNRQVTKLSLSLRVLDEQQIERHYRDSELAELYQLETLDDEPILNMPKDRTLADVFLKLKKYVYQSFEHDSLLENKEEEELDEEERKQAWSEYQQEKLAEQAKANQRKRALDKSTEQPTEKTTEQPTEKITEQATEKTIEQPAENIVSSQLNVNSMYDDVLMQLLMNDNSLE